MVKGRLEKLLILAAVMMFAGACAEGQLTDPNGGDGTEATRLCGNGKVDSGEECDGGVPSSVSCPAERSVGTVTCSNACKFDYSGCTANSVCNNNGVKEAGEECDGTDFGSATCDDTSHVGLKCTNCVLDKSECKAAPSTPAVCGNSIVEDGEECDGPVIPASAACDDPSHVGLSCDSSCKLDKSQCAAQVAGICGDGKINTGEECDGTLFKPGAACPNPGEVGFVCKGDCSGIDTTHCMVPPSGPGTCNNDGNLDAGELCDGTNFAAGVVCPGTTSSAGLTCSSACEVNKDGCPTSTYCHIDGVLDTGELCDGDQLGTQVCPDGTTNGLKCDNTCHPDISGCAAGPGPGPGTCGNGVVDAGEECDGPVIPASAACDDTSHVGLTCDSSCKLDKSQCAAPVAGTCGDGKINIGEECDGTLFKPGAACPNPGEVGFVCKNDCSGIDTTHCIAPPNPANCGNNKLDAGELCEGTDFAAGVVCPGTNSSTGLTCSATCSPDTAACPKATSCNNDGNLDAGELCDGTNLGTLVCPDGTTTGLKCDNTCNADISGCGAGPGPGPGPGARTTPMFTEYVEGKSNNKALEIKNFATSAQECKIEYHQYGKNGGTPTAVGEETLPSIPADGIVVFCNSKANSTLKAKCDYTSGYDKFLQFNGNDTLVLKCGSSDTIVDSFGSTDPQTGAIVWESTLPGGGEAKDYTLRRKCNDPADTNPAGPFNTDGWDAFPQDTFDDLGTYTCP